MFNELNLISDPPPTEDDTESTIVLDSNIDEQDLM